MTKSGHNAASTWAGEIALRNTGKLWTLYWASTGHPVGIVKAQTEAEAVSLAPWPYYKYPNGVYGVEVQP